MSQVATLTLHASQAESGNGQSEDFDTVKADGPAALYIDVTAFSGTGPTMDLVLEEKDPISGKYFDTGLAIAQITGITQVRYTLDNLPGWIYRLRWTLGGGTPNFTFSASLVVKDRG